MRSSIGTERGTYADEECDDV